MRNAPHVSAASWRRSTYSNAQGGDCLEVADGIPGAVPVRDSKAVQRGFLRVPVSSWTAFTATLKH